MLIMIVVNGEQEATTALPQVSNVTACHAAVI